MSGLEQRYDRGNLSIVVSRDGDAGTVTWTGSSDSRDPSELLGPLIRQITQELHGQRVVLDFSQVEYMNSGSLAPMIDLIRELDEVSPQLVVRFADDDWQLFFCRCVRSFARTLRHVRVEGPTLGSPSNG